MFDMAGNEFAATFSVHTLARTNSFALTPECLEPLLVLLPSLLTKHAKSYGLSLRITDFDRFDSLTGVGQNSYGY